jgi:hypothetical protein
LKFSSNSSTARASAAAKRDARATPIRPATPEQTELLASVERLMAKIDYYMHCELDAEDQHERPEIARDQLIETLRRELACRGPVMQLAGFGHDVHPAPNDPMFAC